MILYLSNKIHTIQVFLYQILMIWMADNVWRIIAAYKVLGIRQCLFFFFWGVQTPKFRVLVRQNGENLE
jgi:hypothetical protein